MAKPIITTDAVGCRNVVDHEVTGLLVPVKDSEALANAVLQLLSSPETMHCMGVAGRKKMKADFSEKKVIDKTFNIYFK
jgi:glycosyltransferase involved in cell wall biosynthesis